MGITPAAEMAFEHAAKRGYKLVYFLEDTQELPEGNFLVFTTSPEVCRAVRPEPILLKFSFQDTRELANLALSVGLKQRLLSPGEWVIFARLNGGNGDTWISLKVPEWPLVISETPVMETVEFAQELSSKKVGAAFMIGDAERVLGLSTPLIPNPFKGHTLRIWERKYWDYLTTLASNLDGAFVLDERGVIRAFGVRLAARARVKVEGLGTRHHAVACMTAETEATGVVVSEQDGKIRIFRRSRLEHTLGPYRR